MIRIHHYYDRCPNAVQILNGCAKGHQIPSVQNHGRDHGLHDALFNVPCICVGNGKILGDGGNKLVLVLITW